MVAAFHPDTKIGPALSPRPATIPISLAGRVILFLGGVVLFAVGLRDMFREQSKLAGYPFLALRAIASLLPLQ